MLKKLILCISIMLLPFTTGLAPTAQASEEKTFEEQFPDRILAEKIATICQKKVTDTISQKQLDSIGSLIIKNENLHSIAGIERLTNITGIQITNTSLEDLTPLATLNKLKDLNIPYNKIKTIKGIGKLPVLKNLYLQGNQISDIQSLENTSMRNLNLYDNQLASLAGAEKMSGLTQLDVGKNRIKDTSPLTTLTNLTILRLNSNQITDIAPIKSLVNLTRLELFSNKLLSFRELASFSNLEFLDVTETDMEDLTPVSLLNKLNYLKANRNKLSDVKAVQGLTGLKYLNVAENRISDATPMQYLTQLEELNISYNVFSDISSLGKLKEIKNFYAQGQSIVLPEGAKDQPTAIIVKDRQGVAVEFYAMSYFHYDNATSTLTFDANGKHTVQFQNDALDFSGVIQQTIANKGLTTQLSILDNFRLGDKYITGVYTNPEIVKMTVNINGQIYYGGDVKSNHMKYYIYDRNLKKQDNVTIQLYDKTGQLLENYTLKIEDKMTTSTKWKNSEVAFFGDSITLGLRANIAFPTLVQKNLLLPSIQNWGVSGASLAQSSGQLSLMSKINSTNYEAITDVVLFAGTNDFAYNIPLGTPQGTDVKTFYGALNTSVQKWKASNANVYFVGPMWRARFSGSDTRNSDQYPNDIGVYLSSYNEAMRDVAKRNNIPFLDLYAEKDTYKGTLEDGLHPNNTGQYYLADRVSELLGR
ncbi:leucine-rich repeat domain-containing protein [Listeria rocourtiae]|uniref:leucine-rich repeat domain-containing protein n=1 Tax=Listeria rocourtiae TaxID=647910 RepID=UPI003D2F5409